MRRECLITISDIHHYPPRSRVLHTVRDSAGFSGSREPLSGGISVGHRLPSYVRFGNGAIPDTELQSLRRQRRRICANLAQGRTDGCGLPRQAGQRSKLRQIARLVLAANEIRYPEPSLMKRTPVRLQYLGKLDQRGVTRKIGTANRTRRILVR